MRRWYALACCVLSFSLVRASDARADQAADIAAARALGQDGVLLAEQGKHAQAIEKLERAEKLHHAPTTALKLAESEIEVGKIVSATERLQRLLREPLSPNAPAVFHASYVKAEKVLAAALPKIAVLHVSVRAPAGAKFTVTVDDEPLSQALFDADRPTDPGTHKLSATGKGLVPANARVTLSEGERRDVILNLQTDPNAPPEGADEGAPGAGAGEGSSGSSTMKAVGYTAIGLGVAGLAVGVIGGAVVASKTSSLESECVDKACPRSQEGNIDSAQTWATVSTVGFIVGGVGLASGALLVILGGRSSAATATNVAPTIGLGHVGIGGRF